MRSKEISITGRVRSGRGQAARFTEQALAHEQLRLGLGIEAFPENLNLGLGAEHMQAWRSLLVEPGLPVLPESPNGYGARCYPIQVFARARGPITAGILVPAVADYPPDQVEVLSAVSLRDTLDLNEGDQVTLCTVPVARRRAVLFDVDGTLVNSLDGYRLAAARALEPFGWSVPPEALRDSLNFGAEFWDLVVPPQFRGAPGLIQQLHRSTLLHWPEILASSVGLYPEVEAVLGYLRAAGFRLGICTASRGESFGPLERAGLLSLFDEIVTANEVVHRKPNPEGILLCLKHMAVSPSDAVYVGDTVADILASRRAGVMAVGVLTGGGTSALLSAAGADRLVPTLAALPDLITPALPIRAGLKP